MSTLHVSTADGNMSANYIFPSTTVLFPKHVKEHHPEGKVSIVELAADAENVADTQTLRSLKRKNEDSRLDTFSMGEGCQKTLKLDSELRASNAASIFDCEPIALHLLHDSMPSRHSIYSLMHINDVTNMHANLPFDSPRISAPLKCTIQLHSEQYKVTTSEASTAKVHSDNSYLQKTLCAIIVEKEVVFVLVAEAYGRSKSIDIHGETNQKSYPTPSSCKYESLSVGVFEESDGNGMKQKLKIGSKTMNILVTMSAPLRSQNGLDIGPETSASPQAIRPSTAKIFYRDTEIQRYLDIMRNPGNYDLPTNVVSLRQLVSGLPTNPLTWRYDVLMKHLTPKP
ncbi:uncharacterized protein BYT42DRAFT_612341 [Radiomyces spectabilis]|uniref:uncharacterized protein n=1 Tax=Radiomyces spectabilis TaxID=64574 RepID=UPI00221FC211|nr:uncharacterized protein BYT42DRAFT_612341 [Radiomyces spectabilis]KAI8384658.1 hypothetical protein BYT42DRAFT_612341 [Radiomyces spectabilis]